MLLARSLLIRIGRVDETVWHTISGKGGFFPKKGGRQ
jgi:hypothetical protein